ncbi:MAG TPA: hypothetical protein VI524_02875 [Anaerolineales bacterium]|nr:hypothetical protein [Anaerolineales bacterium]
MLQICFGSYLVLAVPAILVVWMALAAARMHDTEAGSDGQRHYRIALALAHIKNTQYASKYDLLEDQTRF